MVPLHLASSVRPSLFPFHQVMYAEVVVDCGLHARCGPFINVVKTSDRSLLLLERSPGLGMSRVLPSVNHSG